jgi:Uma2 family endonuclease
MGELIRRLGGIPPDRIWLRPQPGTAKKDDVTEAEGRHGRLCELIDGVLVEKTMGFGESRLAFLIGMAVVEFVRDHDLGAVSGEGSTMEILPDQVRIPDVAFVSWQRLAQTSMEPIPELSPDLVVEVLSKWNTKAEMDRKLREYSESGVRLVWYIDPKAREARAYTAPDRLVVVPEDGSLDGGDVLPGFTLGLRDLFAEAERMGPRMP